MPEANIDVAINIFAKPMQLSLSVLSLLRQSGSHISKLWLQYEPKGSAFDKIPPYCIYEYIKEKGLVECEASQPLHWLAREPVDMHRMASEAYRAGIRYQRAFECSKAPFLFITHNDVFILKDILAAMRNEIDDAFAIGQIGQCWNCPAANGAITEEVLGRPACSPATYADNPVSHEQLCLLYAKAKEKGVFVRPYAADGFIGAFSRQPWPLPECRVNEWACLVNLEKIRSQCPDDIFPFGGFSECAGHNLDIGVAWFRALHAKGMKAKHFDILPYMKHWVGTGSKTRVKYAHKEENALAILRRHFPDYLVWIEKRYSISLP